MTSCLASDCSLKPAITCQPCGSQSKLRSIIAGFRSSLIKWKLLPFER